jgi:topoisomerase IA-like protein
MGETIAKTGVKRDPGLIYYIKGGDVWGSPLKKAGQATKGKAQKIATTGIELDYSKFMYYVGTDSGNELVVERTNRQVGGSKRKSKKSAAKKVSAKRGGAKKAAKKTARGKTGGKKGSAKKGRKK